MNGESERSNKGSSWRTEEAKETIKDTDQTDQIDQTDQMNRFAYSWQKRM
ncbi:MAG TPA: hypothetical protein PK344_02455 [Syntrophorhabdaceae bacterium]|nr:hypothetical protein [Syntrophorhabdaceae bacterium]